jgi:hypothetical protein
MADEEIRGRRVTLVPLRATDAGELVGLLDDPIVRGFLGVAHLAALRRVFAGWEHRRSPGGRAGWLNWVVRDRTDRRALGWAQATVERRTATVAYALLWGTRRRPARRRGPALRRPLRRRSGRRGSTPSACP